MSGSEDEGSNLEITAQNLNCALCEKPVDADSKLICCGKCSRLSHANCAGRTEDVEEVSWICQTCAGQADPDGDGTDDGNGAGTGDGDGNGDGAGDDTDVLKDTRYLWNEELQKNAEKQHKMDLEVMHRINLRNYARELARLEEKRQVEYELECKMLAMRKAADEKMRKMKELLQQQYGVADDKKSADEAQKPVVKKHHSKADNTGAYPKHSTPVNRSDKLPKQPLTPLRNPEVRPGNGSGEGAGKGSGKGSKNPEPAPHPRFTPKPSPVLTPEPSEHESSSEDDDEQSLPSLPPPPEEFNQTGPQLTKAHLAARKGPFQRLPTFTGKPEDWPIFYSSWRNSNLACNWSNLENLGRLIDAIQGPALEMVGGQLLYPEMVPTVIETLKKFYGRLELLLQALLLKAKRVESPRIDRLQTFIRFGVVVKQLSDHLIAAGLLDHLVNPMLIQELVEKLPSGTKLEWVRYKRQQQMVTLATFADFLSEIVADASEVTLFTETQHDQGGRDGRDKQKRKEKQPEGYLHTHVGEVAKQQATGAKASNTHRQPTAQEDRKPCRICQRTDHRVRYCDEFGKLSWDQRMKEVSRWKLCNICLNEHGQSRCRFKTRCNIGACQERHHPLLHPPENQLRMAPVTMPCNVHDLPANQPVIFRMVPVKLLNGKRSVDVIAFLDEGASYSLLEREVAEQIQLVGKSQPIIVKWTAGMTRTEKGSKCVTVSIAGLNSNKKFSLKNVHTVEQLKLPEQTLEYSAIAAKYQHLKDLPVADYRSGAPKILIGLKHLHVYAPLESRVGKAGEPIAVRTHLGWTVYGPQDDRDQTIAFSGHHDVLHAADLELHELLKNYFVQEESGVQVSLLPESADDRRAREILEESTVRVGDRYETGLLWRAVQPQLPDSYPMAVKRMKSLERKLAKNQQLQENVAKQIEQYVTKGYAHKLTAQDVEDAVPGKVWYLPLNVVLNPKKPNKIRLVWDAAAAVQGTSLNSALLKGPDLLTNLPVVLYHFRERPIAFGGDIAEMYHQIQIKRSDKQSQRFLYRDDPSGPPQIYVMDRATFGSTSSPCSAQYVKNKNAREFADKFPDAVEAIVDKHYVDDYLDSTDTVDQAVKRAREVKMIHAGAGFHIRSWVSNSAAFLEQLGEPRTEQLVNFTSNKTTDTERVLGVAWDPNEDVFVFSSKMRADLEPLVVGEQLPTKRQVASCVASFFDPHGYLAPFTIHGKLLLQDLWRSGSGWEKQLDGEHTPKWNRWIAVIPSIDDFKIPRCYFSSAGPEDRDGLQLHIFTDASEVAYGCAAYLRAVIKSEPRCALVGAKTKVAPLNNQSIPRLELDGAELGSRLSVAIKAGHSLPITKTVFWTDSKTVLAWIRSDHRRYKQFVAHRIGKILSRTCVVEWRFIPGYMNIADILTKCKTSQPLDPKGEFVCGPDLMFRPETYWPQEEPVEINPTEELRAVHLFHEITLIEPVVDTTRFSSWNVLIRTISCCQRFVSNCRKKQLGQPIATLPSTPSLLKKVNKTIAATVTPLEREEFWQAENFLWRAAQHEAFPDEVKTLLKNRDLPPESWHRLERCSPLFKLSPMLDEYGVIRMEGRSAHAEFLPFELRFPIILPKNHDVTKKLLMFYHRKYGHANRETVVNEIRQRFYIQNVRTAALQVTEQCTWCEVYKSEPKVPRMAPLPDQRLVPNRRPFSFVGIDYFGPINVSVGRRTEKRWVALLTCLTTRAVHMEVAHSLTSQSCIMAIRRFMCRRGVPLEFFSDNGTNFQAVSKELGLQGRQIDIDCAEAFTDARTQWHFNPPSAPHMGGSWERLVRSAKAAMKALDDGRRLTDEVLLTVLAESEEMINCRPLTYLPQASADAEALTPNHFLRGFPSEERKLESVPVDPAQALRDQYKRSQQLGDLLWQRWVKEYIPTINKRTKWYGECQPIAVGDLVFITDASPRRSWTRGIIEQLIHGRDGRIRQAMVRTNKSVLRRPVSKLAVLELGGKSDRGTEPGPELRAGGLLAPQSGLGAPDCSSSPAEN
ncbi:uncharacterized protein LOC119766148 [Culex quinquefasciatus]|uniref:uncharacterized protein LOC119766148 n=1 Tax=Culex quinquefasciatus TaxID=7176 RepID=UPI0018E3E322|nr:uncharacterized protein LOC119766148 [Culex quinquefasciatus]